MESGPALWRPVFSARVPLSWSQVSRGTVYQPKRRVTVFKAPALPNVIESHPGFPPKVAKIFASRYGCSPVDMPVERPNHQKSSAAQIRFS